MKSHSGVFAFAGALLLLVTGRLDAQPSLMENLGRGVVAVRSTATEVVVSWRVLGTDPPDVAFNLYRSTAGAAPIRLNVSPIDGPTHYVDGTADLTQPNTYHVRPILFGLEQAPSASFTVPAAAPVQTYLRVPLQVPPGGTTPAGETYTYSPNDTSAGDLDGDGEYELIVKWDPSNAKDNSQSGYTGPVYLDAYTLAGTRLWRIDLGRNIRAGAHYTQFVVYDLDGDGRAEVACRTADGTVDGAGNVIGNPAADWRNTAGYVLSGPEFLTVFDGLDGHALATAPYIVPRGTVGDWGDTYGNRVDRFLATIAYLDGQRPSLVMARGYYTRTVLAAWNWRDNTLSSVWTFDTGHTGTANPYAAWRGMGNHNLSVGDVDGDGRDEIMYGASAIDDDGTGLFTTGLGHGDAIHMSDMDPDRPGLEVFQPHESPSQYGPNALELRDARTGGLIFGVQGSGDIGRGLALDVDPRYRGYEMWGSGPTGGMYTAQLSTPNSLLGPRGVQIAPGKPSINFGVWWDGDLLRELLDGTTISKWNWLAGNTTRAARAAGRLVEQRHQGHAEPQRRHPRRLARGSDLARVVQRRAAHLHDDHSDDAPALHADARSPVSRRDRVAADRLQPAAAPGILPRRRHGRAAGAEHRDVVAHAARPARPRVHRRLGGHRDVRRRLHHARLDAVAERHRDARNHRHRHPLRRRADWHGSGRRRRQLDARLHRNRAPGRRLHVRRRGNRWNRDDRSALGAIRRHRGHDRAGAADHRDGGGRAGPGVARHGGSRRR